MLRHRYILHNHHNQYWKKKKKTFRKRTERNWTHDEMFGPYANKTVIVFPSLKPNWSPTSAVWWQLDWTVMAAWSPLQQVEPRGNKEATSSPHPDISLALSRSSALQGYSISDMHKINFPSFFWVTTRPLPPVTHNLAENSRSKCHMRCYTALPQRQSLASSLGNAILWINTL